MTVRLLTQEQRDSLIGKKYNDYCYYNPVKDDDDNWIISEYEIENSSLEWLKNLPQIEFKPNTKRI
jgi:hypothetical protein